MSVIGKRTIYVGPADDSNHKPLNIEGENISGGSILPGTVLIQTATGLGNNQFAATVFGQELIVADKNQQQSKSVDDPWNDNENMVGIKLRSGEFANVLVADGNNITTAGTPLALNGVGLLRIALTDGTEQVLCHSDEIINVSGANALVRVRVA